MTTRPNNAYGGGGSFVDAAGVNQILIADFKEGDGAVVITELSSLAPVPEPASLALLGTGLVGLVGLAAIRRRRPKT